MTLFCNRGAERAGETRDGCKGIESIFRALEGATREGVVRPGCSRIYLHSRHGGSLKRGNELLKAQYGVIRCLFAFKVLEDEWCSTIHPFHLSNLAGKFETRQPFESTSFIASHDSLNLRYLEKEKRKWELGYSASHAEQSVNSSRAKLKFRLAIRNKI